MERSRALAEPADSLHRTAVAPDCLLRSSAGFTPDDESNSHPHMQVHPTGSVARTTGTQVKANLTLLMADRAAEVQYAGPTGDPALR